MYLLLSRLLNNEEYCMTAVDIAENNNLPLNYKLPWRLQLSSSV